MIKKKKKTLKEETWIAKEKMLNLVSTQGNAK